MGKSIDIGRHEAPELAALLDDMKDQLLIVLVNRLKDRDSTLVIPIQEIDDTGGYVMDFRVDPRLRNFIFHVQRKS